MMNSPTLIPFKVHAHNGLHQLKISPSTTGAAILAHILTKFPRAGTALFVFLTYKGAVYPLHREITAKFIYEQYRDPLDSCVHILLKEENAYGAP